MKPFHIRAPGPSAPITAETNTSVKAIQLGLLGRQLRFEQQLRGAENGTQGGANLVAHRGETLRLGEIRVLRFLVRVIQFDGLCFELRRLAFQFNEQRAGLAHCGACVVAQVFDGEPGRVAPRRFFPCVWSMTSIRPSTTSRLAVRSTPTTGAAGQRAQSCARPMPGAAPNDFSLRRECCRRT